MENKSTVKKTRTTSNEKFEQYLLSTATTISSNKRKLDKKSKQSKYIWKQLNEFFNPNKVEF